MDQQRHADALHRLQRRIDVAHVGHAGRAVGGGVRRIELGSGEDAFAVAAHQFIRRDVIDQIAGHQRFEADARRHGGADPVPIGGRGRGGGHRRLQVGHHDGAGELAGRGIGHCGQHRAITQVDMPIIGAAQAQGGDLVHGRAIRRSAATGKPRAQGVMAPAGNPRSGTMRKAFGGGRRDKQAGDGLWTRVSVRRVGAR